MPTTKKVFLWTAPRCVSTAFERCVMEIPDSKIFHEPYSNPYHYGPERQSPRYLSQAVDAGASYRETNILLTKQYDQKLNLIFSKDMAYAIENYFDMLLNDMGLREYQHTFLMRDPRKTIPSLYKASVDKQLTGWETFDPHEAGFKQLQELFDFVKTNLDARPVVIDAGDLLIDPEATIKAYCNAIGIPFDESILKWEPGPIKGWETWNGWHESALKSRGFTKHHPDSLAKFEDLSLYPDVVGQCVHGCLPYFKNLSKYKLRFALDTHVDKNNNVPAS